MFFFTISGDVWARNSESKEDVIFGERTFVKDTQELTAVVSQPLDGMEKTGGEVSQVTGFDIINRHLSIRLKHANACFASQHNRPFICRVPVQFAKGTRRKAHVHASNVPRRRNFPLRHFVCAISALNTFRCEVKRVPDWPWFAIICKGRILRVWVLKQQSLIVRTGVRIVPLLAAGQLLLPILRVSRDGQQPGARQGCCSHKPSTRKHPLRVNSARITRSSFN